MHSHTHHHHHSTGKSGAVKSERQRATEQVTLTGAVINLLLSIAQLLGGLFAHSQALIADSIHTLSDLISDFVVLLAARHAHKDADDNHPYGHGRIETVATVILGLMLAGVAVGIFLQAWERLAGAPSSQPVEAWAMWFAGLAIVAKEALYHYTMRTARQFNSSLLQANAWHHRSDAISSVVVLLALAGTQLGFPWLDPVAAIVVAIMILYMAGSMLLDSMSELVDTGIEPERAEEITQFIQHLEGVDSVHMLRTRRMGGEVFADTHIQVNSTISVSEGHRIAEFVMRGLKKQFPEVTDVTVHVDPEDDETSRPSARLPLRAELLESVLAQPLASPLQPFIRATTLHYVDGRIDLDVYLQKIPANPLLADFKQACETVACIGSVSFYHEVAPN